MVEPPDRSDLGSDGASDRTSAGLEPRVPPTSDASHPAANAGHARGGGGDTDEGSGRPSALARWLRIAAFAACIALFAHTLAKSNLHAAWLRIRELGPLALLVLVPFPFALAADAWAWQRLLGALDRRASLRKLFKVRLATEAVTNSAPVGAVWAEALGPVLVSLSTGIPVADVFASSTAKRWLVVRMHGAYVTLAAAFGSAAILHASENLLGNDSLLLFVLIGAAALVLLSLGIEAIAARGQIGDKISKALGGARFPRLQAWIEKRHHHFAHADKQLAKLSSDRKAGAGASARIALVWLVEGFETFLILRLLGADLGLIEVMSFDAGLSVLRSAAIFAPAGIGVQDVGYLAVLNAYGVPDANAIGPAFVVLKRLKEAVYIVIGFIVLATLRRRPRGKVLMTPRPPVDGGTGAPSHAGVTARARTLSHAEGE